MGLGGIGTQTESIARILLRYESISSSRIEGLEVSVAMLLEAEELRRAGIPLNPDSTCVYVLGNTDMILEAIRIGCSAGTMSVEMICHMHELLLAKTQAESIGGVVRTKQNWIGGNRTNPIGAVFVPPRPERVPELLDDLVEFCNTSEYPPVIKAAVAHAQFETIHPFMDGNGRCGRALVHVMTSSLGGVPPLSLVLMADRERYLEHLNAYRHEDEDAADEATNAWVDYFAQALVSSCARAEALDAILAGVQQDWNEKVRFRQGSAGKRILQLLITNPVVTVASLAELVGSSYESCRVATKRLQEAGIVVQSSKNRKSGLFVAQDVVDALTSFERAASTRVGNTRLERPHSPVPQRKRVGVTVPALD